MGSTEECTCSLTHFSWAAVFNVDCMMVWPLLTKASHQQGSMQSTATGSAAAGSGQSQIPAGQATWLQLITD